MASKFNELAMTMSRMGKQAGRFAMSLRLQKEAVALVVAQGEDVAASLKEAAARKVVSKKAVEGFDTVLATKFNPGYLI